MIDYVFGALAVVTVGAYACRGDELNGWKAPWLMLLHAVGGVAAMWVLYGAAVGAAGPLHLLALGGSVLLLVATWSWLPSHAPARRHARYHSDLMVSAPLIRHRDDRD